METITLRPITDENREAVLALMVRDDQPFVAPNDASLRQAEEANAENPGYARPFGIYADDKLVGFCMFSFDPEDEDEEDRYWLWRFMIDKEEQGKGYGQAALAEIIKYFKKNGADRLYLSTEPENELGLHVYHKAGFKETGMISYGEAVMMRMLKGPNRLLKDFYGFDIDGPLGIKGKKGYGVSMAASCEDGVINTYCSGSGRFGQDFPVNPDMLFQAGSVSKPAFAATVMRYVDKGKIDLDADISGIVPEFVKKGPVTFSALLSHTAGYNVHGFPGYRADHAPLSLEDVLNGKGVTPRLRRIKPYGKQHVYSACHGRIGTAPVVGGYRIPVHQDLCLAGDYTALFRCRFKSKGILSLSQSHMPGLRRSVVFAQQQRGFPRGVGIYGNERRIFLPLVECIRHLNIRHLGVRSRFPVYLQCIYRYSCPAVQPPIRSGHHTVADHGDAAVGIRWQQCRSQFQGFSQITAAAVRTGMNLRYVRVPADRFLHRSMAAENNHACFPVFSYMLQCFPGHGKDFIFIYGRGHIQHQPCRPVRAGRDQAGSCKRKCSQNDQYMAQEMGYPLLEAPALLHICRKQHQCAAYRNCQQPQGMRNFNTHAAASFPFFPPAFRRVHGSLASTNSITSKNRNTPISRPVRSLPCAVPAAAVPPSVSCATVRTSLSAGSMGISVTGISAAVRGISMFRMF